MRRLTGGRFGADGNAFLTGNTGAVLGPLASNGGPAETLLPQIGSPAINAIPTSTCESLQFPGSTTPTDQRGTPRPQGGACEIGAVEVAAPVITKFSPTAVSPARRASRSPDAPAVVKDGAMATDQPGYQLYQDLAEWWPLISPPEEYAEEARFAAQVLRQAGRPVREVLELGSGGGHCASHLTPAFTMTLVDASAGMLAVSRRLNPGCEHVQADMRTVRLGRDFDAVFIHDAVCYMTTEADLRLVIGTAFAHCRPGGIAVFVPDNIAENFQPGTGYGGSDGTDGRAARYLDWAYDPDPGDTWTLTQYAFLLRDASGAVRVAHETHRLGLFGRGTWLRLLREAGFRAAAVTEETAEDRRPRELFTASRPPHPGGAPGRT